MRTIGGLSTPLDGASTPVAQNPYTDPSMLDSETDRSFSQSTLAQTKSHRLLGGSNDTLIAHREREIEDIAQSIIDLANIFQEIQTMVIDQGSLLDRIDYNVEKMGQEVRAADRELTVAGGYQKRSIKRKAILLLVILVAGMCILLGLKISGRRGGGGGGSTLAPVAPVDDVGGPDVDVLAGRRALVLDAGSGLYRRDWRRRRKRWAWEGLEEDEDMIHR
jgi:syntaxin 16